MSTTSALGIFGLDVDMSSIEQTVPTDTYPVTVTENTMSGAPDSKYREIYSPTEEEMRRQLKELHAAICHRERCLREPKPQKGSEEYLERRGQKRRYREQKRLYRELAPKVWERDYPKDNNKNVLPRGKIVRFAYDPEMREGPYRYQREYSRGNESYVPGRFAVKDGGEYWDTSNFTNVEELQGFETTDVDKKVNFALEDHVKIIESAGGDLGVAHYNSTSRANSSKKRGPQHVSGDAMDSDIASTSRYDDLLASHQPRARPKLDRLCDPPEYNPYKHSTNGNIGPYFLTRDIASPVDDGDKQMQDCETGAQDSEQMSVTDFEMFFFET